MSKQVSLLFLVIFTCIVSYSQTKKEYNKSDLENFKKKFYLNREIGVDSSLYYMDRLLQSDDVAYKTFGYAATEYLKVREKQPINIPFKDSINKYLPKMAKTNKNFPLLFDIHILLGNSDKRKKLIKSALQNYIAAENYAFLAEDIERTIKIKGNIALIYQDMGELDKALNKAKETLELIEINKEALSNKYYSSKYKRMFNVAAIYATLYKNDKERQQYADSSLHYYNSILKTKEFNLNNYYTGKVYYGKGTIYTLKEEYSKASSFLEKSLELFEKSKSQSYLYKGYYNNAYNYYMSNKLNKAKENFLKVLKIKKDTILDYNYLHTHYYLSKIHSKQNKIDSAKYHLNTFIIDYDKLTSRKKQQINGAYKIDLDKKIKELKELKEYIANKSSYYRTIFIILILILLIISFLVVKNSKEKRKANEKLDELLAKISKKEDLNEKSFSSPNPVKIKDEQHQQIINGLLKIEEKKYFLKEEFNLYNAAKKIGTNTTYLSKIIKDYKKMSFNDYTNELRINYIIGVLSNDKKVRSYTTQAIGEIAGYKNSKSFTRIFKKHIGITPYQFIEKINKEL
ncbi:helix-turn-helix domain-containing protein [Tenacibaculum sp. 1B UA]|uniref:helix-turn-helix domain-containing protein n=1 Tax=Tenacibaculum sp. 1B UA TaxID=2922252 RepID=UPI002A23A44A|nr:helix-turn-helix domain-containing protein [Tenacibaculum sp. 1B UA]MDX8553119.1 helix-turn-helix domain-containing protein [Tenacibaculum sp. 1B UA]